MSDSTDSPVISPYLCYADGMKAIDWLEKAFGFVRIAAYANDEGELMHGELKAGNGGLVMMSGRNEKLQLNDPASLGASTFGTFVRLDSSAEVDAVHKTAVENGAKIVFELKHQDHGSYEFTCIDPQGHVWTLGTYNPDVG
ncbi:VOC family protein [Amycolatopsis minnesotensis]|uniref:VOC family protein n=1 Tax=Amycolatopsis minnesotensis TaxID=337894 RepID=A0ABN2QKX7_9PSEU